MGKVIDSKPIFTIGVLNNGVIFTYKTNMGTDKKALFSSTAKARECIDRYLQKQYPDKVFFINAIGQRTKL
jgi:hypothetical protein